MKKRTTFLLSLLLLFSLTACGASSSELDRGTASGNTGGSSSSSISSPGYDMEAVEDAGDIWFSSTSADSAIYSDPDAKVIRTAKLTIQTTEFEQSVSSLAALTEKYGGYYESAEVDGGSYYDARANRVASYVVRIPKENFIAFRDQIGEVGHIYSISETSDDVGETYYDTEARLATLETKQERLLALLEKAELMEDIISLEDALAEVQYEIDMHNTTLRKYDSLIDYSTFTIYLEEVVKISTEPTPEDGFFTKLGASFSDGWENFTEGLEDFALWVARNIISLVIVAIIIVVAVNIFLRQRKKRRTKYNGEE